SIWRCSSRAATPWDVSWPPSQSVSSTRHTLHPRRAAASAAATPPVPPPTTSTSHGTSTSWLCSATETRPDRGSPAAGTLITSTKVSRRILSENSICHLMREEEENRVCVTKTLSALVALLCLVFVILTSPCKSRSRMCTENFIRAMRHHRTSLIW